MLEQLVWDSVADLLRNPAQIAAAWDSNAQSSDKPTAELARLQNRQKSLDQQWNRLLDLYQDALISKDDLSQRKATLDAERRATASRIDEIQRLQGRLAIQAQLTADFEQFCADAQKMLETPPKETKQEVLRLLIEEIVVADNEIIIKHIIPHDDNYRLIPRDSG